MARDGSGGYDLPYPVFTPNTLADADQVTANNADLITAIAQSIAYDGQTVPVANLPMGTYRHTGVGNATARTDYAAYGQVQDGVPTWAGTAGGTADALTLTLTPAITAYATGQRFAFTAASTNTGAATVAINGLAAQAIQRGGSALTAGDIVSGRQYELIYAGGAFQLGRQYDPAIRGTTGAFSSNVTTAGTFIAPLGSAASPSYTFTGDTNTGLYSAGADQAAMATGGAIRALWALTGETVYGTVTATATDTGFIATNTTPTTGRSYFLRSIAAGGFTLRDSTAGQDRVLVGATGNWVFDPNVSTVVGGRFTFYHATASETVSFVSHNASSGTVRAQTLQFGQQAPNDATSFFLRCTDTGADRAFIYSNGGLANYSANNVNLSDEREKTDIAPFDAAADLEAFLAFPFVNYKYADQTHADFNLGTGAQSALASHPGNARYVDPEGWIKEHDPEGNPVYRMAVFDGDIHYRTGAQTQYAHRRINELEAALAAALERIEALESA